LHLLYINIFGLNKTVTMAKPIKHTPILKGKDAINFFAQMEENKSKKVDFKSVLSIRNDAAKLRSLLRN